MPDPNPPDSFYALSIKQPWAALIAAGRKTIEVRTWPVSRRSPVLIHAAKVPDLRPEGWAAIDTPELKTLSQLQGGIIGVADLADCIRYDSAEAFAADAPRHFNATGWFRPPRMYGFAFESARVLSFVPWTGNTFFFAAPGYTLPEPVEPDASAPAVIWIDPPEGSRKGIPAP
jgi:hypothetical protein